MIITRGFTVYCFIASRLFYEFLIAGHYPPGALHPRAFYSAVNGRQKNLATPIRLVLNRYSARANRIKNL